MGDIDFTRLDERKAVIEQINGSENYSRKRRAQKAYDIYNDIIEPYLMEILSKEFSQGTIQQMRKCYSINISRRIVQEEASIYNTAPTRTFGNVNEKEELQLNNIYAAANTNTKMLYLNRYYRLLNQAFLQVVPHNGILDLRVLTPHQVDVIPSSYDARIPYAYIQNVWPKDYQSSAKNPGGSYQQNDMMNQSIADVNDRQGEEQVYITWTSEYQMKFDGKGELLEDPIENPIKKLPFIDVSSEKDYQFFVNRGYPISDYALELSVDLSDLSSIARMQGWAYAIVYSENPPQNLVVGPNQVLWMKLDPNKPEIQPRFEFVSPSPDLAGQMNVAQAKLRTFLASRNIKAKSIAGDGAVDSYSSGLERMLAMIDRYTSSREDLDLFRRAEDQLFNLYRDWSNNWIEYNDERALKDELRISRINDQAWVDVKYAEPEAVQTSSEKLDQMLKEMDAGIRTRVETIMEMRGVDEETAEQILEMVNNDMTSLNAPSNVNYTIGYQVPDQEAEQEDEIEMTT